MAHESLVLSYLGLRKVIGFIGIALPFVLVVGSSLIDRGGLLPTISDYYYSSMGDVFVGSLCAIGVFLLSYRGYERIDDLAGDFACVCAVGVALFPTTPAEAVGSWPRLAGILHYGFAVGLFSTLAFFALVLFRKAGPGGVVTDRKRQRNVIYALCGATIIAAQLLILAYAVFARSPELDSWRPVLWLETIAMLAFGIAWLTKGEAILADL